MSKKVIKTKPDDGFVHEADIHEVNPENYGKYFKGKSKSIIISTSDPKITRPFVYSICGLFFGIGLITLLCGLWIFTIPFIGISVFAFIKSKKDIDEIEKKMKS